MKNETVWDKNSINAFGVDFPQMQIEIFLKKNLITLGDYGFYILKSWDELHNAIT